jgi:hypothetical protein
MTDRDDYWAKHPGVAGTLSNECVRLHDSFWTQGPDGKAYPTWHPPVATAASTEVCFFGHEHGDDPSSSPFYVDPTYQPQRDSRVIPIPFGYANEVLAANGGARHEDHFGHKIYREEFEAAYGNSTSPASVMGTGAICTALLKLHQGTHGPDAITHHLHEAVAHVACTALPGYVPSRVHVTALVPLGRPGWFSNNCGPYRVPNQTGGTRGTGENNAPSGGHAHEGNPPVALGSPSRIANLDTVALADLEQNVDGERIIPGAPCLWTYESPGSTKANKVEFGHAANDTWVRPLMITDAGGNNRRMMLKSYYSVFNPSRVFWIESDGAIGSRASVDACRNPPPGGPTRPSALCQKVRDNGGISAWSIDSPYTGTVRNVNFKSLQIGNHTGATTIWTDAYGREVTLADPARAIKQYVSAGYNGMEGSGVDATIAAPPNALRASLKVCRSGSGPYPTLAMTDPCYWAGNDDLLFSKEWWRDMRDPALRIHAPN